jgi:hypothetical protein
VGLIQFDYLWLFEAGVWVFSRRMPPVIKKDGDRNHRPVNEAHH